MVFGSSPKDPTEVGVPNDDPKERIGVEATSRISPYIPESSPRRSPRLTPAAKAKDVQFLSTAEQKNAKDVQVQSTEEPKNEPVVKNQIARKLILKKNTRAAVQIRKEDKSPYMKMFYKLVQNCLPKLIRIDYDIGTFGITWKTYLDKAICEEIMDFKEVSNCAINIWIK